MGIASVQSCSNPLRRRSDYGMMPPVNDPFAFDIDDTHLRRERARARDLRHSQWWKRRLAKGVCHWCGRPTPAAELTMDHVVPIARGGRSTRGNVVPCCKPCNNRKKQLLPMEWEAYLERVRHTDRPES